MPIDISLIKFVGDLLVKVLPHGEGLPLPSYATTGSAGLDLYAAIKGPQMIRYRSRVMIPTGIAVALPKDTVGFAMAKSGRAKVEGLVLPHGVGVIDEDYRGELVVLLTNLDQDEPISLDRGQKIAQLLVVPYVRCGLKTVAELPVSERGEKGFGSTGLD